MAKLNILTLGSSKTYTKESLLGGGAVVGKNVTISSITPIDGGNRVTFSYTLEDGTVKTSTMDVMNGADGEPGAEGITPEITIGTVETLSAGSNATATITGTAEKPVLNLGIPKGSDGYTPVKCTDYWTTDDKAEIQSYIDTQIGGALNGSY